MGKASRQKKKRKAEAPEISSHSRGKAVIVSSLIAALAGGIGYAHFRANFPQKPAVQTRQINFGFLQRDQTEIERKVQEAVRYPLINVHEGTGLLDPLDYILYNNLATSAEVDQYLAAFRKEANLKGIDCLETKIGSGVKSGIRVIPETKYDDDVKQYLTLAMNFLRRHNAFQDLEIPKVEWIDDYSQKRNLQAITGFIGLIRVLELELPFECVQQDGKREPGGVIIHKPHRSSQAYFMRFEMEPTIKVTRDANPYVFINTAASTAAGAVGVLQAPFSEILPFMLFPGIERYVEQESRPTLHDVQTVIEAISESLSLYLVEQLLQTAPMREALRFVSVENIRQHRFTLAQKREVYSLVPAAYDFLRMHGVQETVQSFMSNPSEYLAAIKDLAAR